jgi:glycosyltransferase involved in cell wall biosynthesis
MTPTPRLSIGLPVYNGERYLAEALDALLGQTYRDFELIISDNASTDSTEEICRRYAEQDPRVRYIRQPRNIGCAANHNVVFEYARGELFKWVADDDLYARDLVERCIELLDENPDAVLVHSWSAVVEGDDVDVARPITYPLETSSPSAPVRFRSILIADGGDDDYGVIRSEVLRKVRPYDSFYHADRTIPAELVLHGRFLHVPDWLYFRREHPGSNEQEYRGVRAFCVNYDAKRANRWRHPVARLLAEYVWAYVALVNRAPLSTKDRRACYGHIARWLTSRAAVGGPSRAANVPPPRRAVAAGATGTVPVRSVVPGQGAGTA